MSAGKQRPGPPGRHQGPKLRIPVAQDQQAMWMFWKHPQQTPNFMYQRSFN